MVEKIRDAIRFVVVSPEVLAALLVLLVAYYWPGVITFIEKFINKADLPTAGAVIGVPLALLISAYKLGFDVLNPTEKKQVLKDWPRYWMLKNRIGYSLVLGTLSFLGTCGSYYATNAGAYFFGTVVLVVCWTVMAAAVASIAIARMTIHDILNSSAD